MRLLEQIRRFFVRSIRQNASLVVLWLLLVAIVPHVPPETPISRNDLVPWTMVCLSAVAFLRGKPLGQGPHPMLTRQRSGFGRWCLRAAMIATPITLMFWYDFGRLFNDMRIAQFFGGVATAMTIGIIVALVLGRREQRTAWNPRGLPTAVAFGVGMVVFIGLSFAVGYLENAAEQFPLDLPLRRGDRFPGDVILLGIAFLAVGLVVDRPQHFRQRRAAGLKDGSPYKPKLFPFVFASLGSAVGLGLLYVLQDFFRIGVDIDFDEAYLPAAFIVAWAAVIWPPRTPIAVTCMLHEVMPSGGSDSWVKDTANPFEKPPEGALRLNPLRIRRVRSLHPWLVPVKATRIPELDDPIRPLWGRREPPLPYHILGAASFEADEVSKQEQWDRITIRLKGQDETRTLKGSAQTQRMAILRPFLEPGESRRSQIRTYTWERPVPDATVQIVDANTQRLLLTDGCVIVLSTEGVARAYELEIGVPVYQLNEAIGFRPPQLEDYVKV
jgi:hypothetical protein